MQFLPLHHLANDPVRVRQYLDLHNAGHKDLKDSDLRSFALHSFDISEVTHFSDTAAHYFLYESQRLIRLVSLRYLHQTPRVLPRDIAIHCDGFNKKILKYFLELAGAYGKPVMKLKDSMTTHQHVMVLKGFNIGDSEDADLLAFLKEHESSYAGASYLDIWALD